MCVPKVTLGAISCHRHLPPFWSKVPSLRGTACLREYRSHWRDPSECWRSGELCPGGSHWNLKYHNKGDLNKGDTCRYTTLWSNHRKCIGYEHQIIWILSTWKFVFVFCIRHFSKTSQVICLDNRVILTDWPIQRLSD